MRTLLFLLPSLLLHGCQSDPHVQTSGKDQARSAEPREMLIGCEQFTVKLGDEFKIKNTSWIEVNASIVEKEGKHYIRSGFRHGWTSELRDYAITNAVQFVTISGCSINIFFPHAAEAKLVGAVYVINNHGEAVKVDDITMVDLTW